MITELKLQSLVGLLKAFRNDRDALQGGILNCELVDFFDAIDDDDPLEVIAAFLWTPTITDPETKVTALKCMLEAAGYGPKQGPKAVESPEVLLTSMERTVLRVMVTELFGIKFWTLSKLRKYIGPSLSRKVLHKLLGEGYIETRGGDTYVITTDEEKREWIVQVTREFEVAWEPKAQP